MTDVDLQSIEDVVQVAKAAQYASEQPHALKMWRSPIRSLRRSLAADPVGWAELIDPPQERTLAESLAAEVGPLADACHWIQRNTYAVLKSRHEGAWLWGLSIEVRRKPLGVVLVIGASNYPLFLLAVPAIQAIAAGNSVLLKPPPGGEAVAKRLRDTLVEGGLDPLLCVLLDSSVRSAEEAIDAGVDHVVFTGSAATGRAVARRAAERLTPCTLECSGSDAVIVEPTADLNRVADCVTWGMRFNSGATCIAPRFLFVGETKVDELVEKVRSRLSESVPRRISQRSAEETRRLVGEAIREGAEVISPQGFGLAELESACESGSLPPLVLRVRLADGRPALFDVDLFAPVLTICPVATDEEHGVTSVWEANDSPFALGASVFGNPDAAAAGAQILRAGCVTVNDLIAPTADPRVPFGGAGESGYGVTRGAEGLLAMTRPQAIVTRRGRWLPHLDPPTPALDDLLAGMIQSTHAKGWAARFAGLRKLVTAAKNHSNAINHRDTESTEETTPS